ncbi:hypothetical protein ACAW74_26035 [Fibrella sp. WM1]|uniref:hypothetical protein n=1 Tax=Fibrella musci TaxID=3242485 RepID=UPI00351FCB39
MSSYLKSACIMSESELIDKMLADFAANRDLGLLSEEASLMYPSSLRKMAAYGLLQSDNRRLTEKGYQALEAGGFDKWKANNEQQEAEARRATLGSAYATIDAAQSAKRSLIVAWVSGVVAILAFVFSLVQWWDNRQSQSELSVLRAKLVELDSLYNVKVAPRSKANQPELISPNSGRESTKLKN